MTVEDMGECLRSADILIKCNPNTAHKLHLLGYDDEEYLEQKRKERIGEKAE